MAYTWRQDNATATCGIVVPTGTAHSQLKVVLSRRRLTLELAGSGVGLAATQLAREGGASAIFVTAGSQEKIDMAKAMGATEGFSRHDNDGVALRR